MMSVSQGSGTSEPAPAFPDAERYSRQTLFAEIGEAGQSRLFKSHVAIAGVGATGAALASLLARAGVGKLTLIDRDYVEPSNLQRQVLFDEADAHGYVPKAEAARRHLNAINSAIDLEAHVADLTPENIEALLGKADLVLDGTDNFETRYLLNDFCVREGKPWIYTAAVGSYAATMNVLPKQGSGAGNQESEHKLASVPDSPFPVSCYWRPTACLACLFPQAPSGDVESCETGGILGTAVNFAASVSGTEALKFLTGRLGQMRRTLLSFDLWTSERGEVAAGDPSPGCEVCDRRQFRALAGEGRAHITLCGRNSVQIHERHRPVDLRMLQERLAPLGEVRTNGLLLRFVRPPYTLTVFPDGRALIQGTTDSGIARSLYARFVGA